MYKEKKHKVGGTLISIVLLILIVIFSNNDGENSVLENIGSKFILHRRYFAISQQYLGNELS